MWPNVANKFLADEPHAADINLFTMNSSKFFLEAGRDSEGSFSLLHFVEAVG